MVLLKIYPRYSTLWLLWSSEKYVYYVYSYSRDYLGCILGSVCALEKDWFLGWGLKADGGATQRFLIDKNDNFYDYSFDLI